jgi:hypothetical protein
MPRSTHSLILTLILCLATQSAFAGEKAIPLPLRVDCEGHYPAHLQGICLDQQGNIYWSFTTWLVKTDAQGKLINKIPVANHHGDCCYDDGRVYVAVNLGNFNDPVGNADSWVYVYEAEDLKEIAKHEVQQVKYGAGGIASHNGRFIVVGGLPETIDENYLYEFNRDFKFIKKHILASGHTHLGIQGATFHNNQWWFACYGTQLLRTTADFDMIGRYTFECGLGIVTLDDARLYIARGKCQKPDGCNGHLLQATPDPKLGLIITKAK